MDPEDLRAAIPVCDRGVYFNTGASGPAPRHVVEAATEFLEHHEYVSPVEEGAYPAAFETFDETREVIADFLGADPLEIALTDSTADGIARVAAAIDWEPGDTVVRTDLEHSAGVIPWWNLREQGVEVSVLDTEAGRLDVDALTDAVSDPDARLLCCNSSRSVRSVSCHNVLPWFPFFCPLLSPVCTHRVQMSIEQNKILAKKITTNPKIRHIP